MEATLFKSRFHFCYICTYWWQNSENLVELECSKIFEKRNADDKRNWY